VLERNILEKGPLLRSSQAWLPPEAGRKYEAQWNVNEYHILWKNFSISGQITQDN